MHMYKTIKVTNLVFEMINDLSKKRRIKPEVLIESLVKKEFSQK